MHLTGPKPKKASNKLIGVPDGTPIIYANSFANNWVTPAQRLAAIASKVG